MKYDQDFKEKYKRLIKSVKGFSDLSWYRRVHIPRIIKHKERYRHIAAELKIPICLVPLIETKEMGSKVGKFSAYIGNGQPWNKKTTVVPKNKGPFKSWEAGVRDAVKQEGLDKVDFWDEPRLLFELESYNGWGYHYRKKESAYLWSKTLPHGLKTGQFVRDHVYSSTAIPKNIGVWATYHLLCEADSDFKLAGKSTVPKKEERKTSLLQVLTDFLYSFFEKIFDKPEVKAKDVSNDD